MFEPDYSTLVDLSDAIQLLKDVREMLVSIHHLNLAVHQIPATPERSASYRLLAQVMLNSALVLYPIPETEQEAGNVS